MFNDFSCDRKDNTDECWANVGVVTVICEKIWHRTVVISWSRFRKRSGTLQRIAPKELGIISRMKCSWNSQKADILFPCNDSIVQVYSQEHKTWKLSRHFTADYPTIETVFRIIISANQFSLCGAVANICEESEGATFYFTLSFFFFRPYCEGDFYFTLNSDSFSTWNSGTTSFPPLTTSNTPLTLQFRPKHLFSTLNGTDQGLRSEALEIQVPSRPKRTQRKTELYF